MCQMPLMLVLACTISGIVFQVQDSGNGEKAAPDDEDDKQQCDFAPRHRLLNGVWWGVQSGVIGTYS
jgi:hypothetical protein